MDVIHERCAGIDISKADVKVCVRLPGPGRRRHRPRVSSSVIQLIRAAHSHPRSRAVAAASVRLRAPNLAIADER